MRLPEAALHRIWEAHSVLAPHLRTHDGQPVTVLRPGTPNPDSGPDFLYAVIRIGETTFCGDVEIHTTPAQWHLHRHNADPRYNRVILHVVGDGARGTRSARTAAGRTIPLLILPPFPSPLPPSPTDQKQIVTRCVSHLVHSRDPHRTLARAGWTRIHRKVNRFAHRLDQLVSEQHGIIAEPESFYDVLMEDPRPRGCTWSRDDLMAPHLWEQLLYEGVMEAMGYARNSAAFLLLARTLPIGRLQAFGLHNTDTMMGVLFGAAGLLPDADTIIDAETAGYVRRLQRRCRECAGMGYGQRASEIDWLFFRLRPANFPTARLASMAYLLPGLFAGGQPCALLRDLAGRNGDAKERLRKLRMMFAIQPGGHWAHHLHFRDRWKERGVFLGKDRIAAIILNVVLPLGLLYARIADDDTMARSVRTVLHALPPPHEPHIVREIREKTFGKGVRLGVVEGVGLLELQVRVKREK
jgi:hypothetical protein